MNRLTRARTGRRRNRGLSCGHDAWAPAWQQNAQGRSPQESSIASDH
jgi:hypothetical protein